MRPLPFLAITVLLLMLVIPEVGGQNLVGLLAEMLLSPFGEVDSDSVMVSLIAPLPIVCLLALLTHGLARLVPTPDRTARRLFAALLHALGALWVVLLLVLVRAAAKLSTVLGQGELHDLAEGAALVAVMLLPPRGKATLAGPVAVTVTGDRPLVLEALSAVWLDRAAFDCEALTADAAHPAVIATGMAVEEARPLSPGETAWFEVELPAAPAARASHFTWCARSSRGEGWQNVGD